MDPREEATEVRPTSPVEASIERLNDLSDMLAKRIDELGRRLDPVRRAIPAEGPVDGNVGVDRVPSRSTIVLLLDELSEKIRNRITGVEEIIASIDL